MTKELAKRFSEEVENYRRALDYFARKCEWEEFKARAGRLFDYVEDVEASERERCFFSLFYTILVCVAGAAAALIGLDAAEGAWAQYRTSLFLVCLAACGFELFFYLNFRRYADNRKSGFRKRREAFIRGIERDFRSLVPQQERS